MMQVVDPVVFVPAALTSTTATEIYPLWTASSYAADVYVVHPISSVNRVWLSLVAANTATPGTDPTKWQDVAPGNKVAMFDNSITTQTVAAGSLTVVLNPAKQFSTLALLNLEGTSVVVELKEGAVVTFSETRQLVEDNINDWFDFFHAESEQKTTAIFLDLPGYTSTTLTLTFSGPSIKVGHLVYGSVFDIGRVQYGASSGIIDYSVKEKNEFGDTLLTERVFADEMSVSAEVDNGRLNSLKQKLRKIRAKPSLWLGVPEDQRFDEVFTIFGWYRTHNIVVPYPDTSLVDFELESLT